VGQNSSCSEYQVTFRLSSVVFLGTFPVLATWDIRSEKAPWKRSTGPIPLAGKKRHRENQRACMYFSFGIFLFLCEGEACVPCSHPSQTTHSSVLSRTPRWHCSLDETALHLSSAWNDCRPCQREVRTACRKCVVTRASHHSASAGQAINLQEDRSVPLVASGDDALDLEAGALHGAAADLASVASRTLPLVLEAQVKG
jgi:hypothetical protein